MAKNRKKNKKNKRRANRKKQWKKENVTSAPKSSVLDIASGFKKWKNLPKKWNSKKNKKTSYPSCNKSHLFSYNHYGDRGDDGANGGNGLVGV